MNRLEQCKAVAKAYCKLINADLVYVNEYEFGIEKDEQHINITWKDLEEMMKGE